MTALLDLFQVNALLKELISKLPLPPVPHGTEALIETIWLLMTSVVAVPAICRLPGGSPVLGFLVRLLAHLHMQGQAHVRQAAIYVSL